MFVLGVSHAEDLRYLFRINTSRNEVSEDDYRTRYRLVRLWSNFVKYGYTITISL